MEVCTNDAVAEEKCRGKRQEIVKIVHRHLGLASVVDVSDMPDRDALKLETAWGSVVVDYDLNVLPECTCRT